MVGLNRIVITYVVITRVIHVEILDIILTKLVCSVFCPSSILFFWTHLLYSLNVLFPIFNISASSSLKIGISLSSSSLLLTMKQSLDWFSYDPCLGEICFRQFGMGPLASGRRPCDIVRVLFRNTKSRVRNFERLARRNYTDYN